MKSHKNVLVYYIVYVIIKDLKYAKIYSVNPLYLFFNKVHEYFEEINGKKYLTQRKQRKNKTIRRTFE